MRLLEGTRAASAGCSRTVGRHGSVSLYRPGMLNARHPSGSVTVPRCLRSYWEMLCAVPKQRPAGLSWSPGGRSIPVLLAASLKPSAALQPAGTRRACSSTSAGPPQAGSMPQQQPPCGGAGSGGCRAQSGVCPGAVSPLPGRGRVALTFQFTLRYRRAAQVCGEGRQTHGNTLAEIKPHWHPERSSTIYSL